MIELTGPTSVSVVAPINDKLLCFGMLEMAKMAIEEHHRELFQPTPLAHARGDCPAPKCQPTNTILGRRRRTPRTTLTTGGCLTEPTPHKG